MVEDAQKELTRTIFYGCLDRILACQLDDTNPIWSRFQHTFFLLAVITPCSTGGQDASMLYNIFKYNSSDSDRPMGGAMRGRADKEQGELGNNWSEWKFSKNRVYIYKRSGWWRWDRGWIFWAEIFKNVYVIRDQSNTRSPQHQFQWCINQRYLEVRCRELALMPNLEYLFLKLS